MSTPQAALSAAQDCWNAGDLDGYWKLYDERIQLHGYSPEPLNKSQVRAFYEGIFTAFGPTKLDFHEVIWDGDSCAIRFSMTGRHVAEFMGVPHELRHPAGGYHDPALRRRPSHRTVLASRHAWAPGTDRCCTSTRLERTWTRDGRPGIACPATWATRHRFHSVFQLRGASGSSRQQHSGFPHRTSTTPRSTRHPQSAQVISTRSYCPIRGAGRIPLGVPRPGLSTPATQPLASERPVPARRPGSPRPAHPW